MARQLAVAAAKEKDDGTIITAATTTTTTATHMLPRLDRSGIVLEWKAALVAVSGETWEDHMVVFEPLHAAAIQALREVMAPSGPVVLYPPSIVVDIATPTTCHCTECEAFYAAYKHNVELPAAEAFSS